MYAATPNESSVQQLSDQLGSLILYSAEDLELMVLILARRQKDGGKGFDDQQLPASSSGHAGLNTKVCRLRCRALAGDPFDKNL